MNIMKGLMIKKRKGEASWISWIKKRIDNNLNFLSVTTGSTGAGKSFSCLSIAEQLDPDFEPRYQIGFSFLDFMRAVNRFSGQDLSYLENESQDFKPLHKRKYKVLIFEETQTSLNKRNWQSKINKLFLFILSTFRHKNIIVLFNMPYADYFDSSSMKLIHAKFESQGWSKKTEQTYIRPKVLQYNDKLSKFYEHSLYVIENNKLHKFAGLWGIPKPSQHLIDKYESMKTDFTNKLNAKITQELENLENPNERKPLTARQEEVLKILANIKESNKYQRCSEMLGIATSTISETVAFAKKKGYTIEEFVEEVKP